MHTSSAPPTLSIIVIVYDMVRQAMNTLYTLSPQYQLNVLEDDYEVVIVENTSQDNLEESVVQALGANFRYFRRKESGVSPTPAINFAFQQCRSSYVGLMIDGARIVTPRVLQYALYAYRLAPNAVVMVPGYNLGPAEQHTVSPAEYNETIEQQHLADIRWQENGYRLFDLASMGGAHQFGYLIPPMESNCLFSGYTNFEKIGFADERFDLSGGGALNLHMYRSLGLLPDTQYFVLAGEGNFHQMHGGVTTRDCDERDAIVEVFRDQLQEIWNHNFHGLRRDPILLGTVTSHAQRFLLYSSERSEKRLERFHGNQADPWVDDSAVLKKDRE